MLINFNETKNEQKKKHTQKTVYTYVHREHRTTTGEKNGFLRISRGQSPINERKEKGHTNQNTKKNLI